MARVQEEEINSLHAGVCAGLSDPKRIMILYELADGPKKVTDLANAPGPGHPQPPGRPPPHRGASPAAGCPAGPSLPARRAPRPSALKLIHSTGGTPCRNRILPCDRARFP